MQPLVSCYLKIDLDRTVSPIASGNARRASASERRNNDAVNRAVGRLDAALRIGVAGVRKAAEHNSKGREDDGPGCESGYPAHGDLLRV
jgi:hypothetical protein